MQITSVPIGGALRASLLACAICSSNSAAGAPAGGADLSTIRPFQVYDLSGKRIGLLYDRFAQLTLKGKRYAVPLEVDFPRSDLWRYSRNFVVFTSPDCAGQAYKFFDGGSQGPMPQAVLRFVGNKALAYVPQDPAVAVELTYNSLTLLETGECRATSGVRLLVPLQDPIDIAGRYQEPFHVK